MSTPESIPHPIPRIETNPAPIAFPPLEQAWSASSPAPGLLAWGGDLSAERLVAAYSQGIFPWFSEDDPILWWSPDPRMVLYPEHFKLSRSLDKTLRKFLRMPECEIRVDSAFPAVIHNCSTVVRAGQNSTWILPEMVAAYIQLHEQGVAHSFETWVKGELVGGLYGINLGGMFYGESMFAYCTDASKLALCGLIAFARYYKMPLIDCQQKTQHLSSLGAHTIPRAQFAQEMHQAQQCPAPHWLPGVLPQTCWLTLWGDKE